MDGVDRPGCEGSLVRRARQIEAVNLADHGIARDPIAEAASDLAGTQPLRP
jgi:hypothetical protein